MSEKQPEAMLGEEHVRKIAKLSRLELSTEQVARYQRELGSVLGSMEKLAALSGIEAFGSEEPQTRARTLRADVPGATLDVQVLNEMAPSSAGPLVMVPKVIGEESA